MATFTRTNGRISPVAEDAQDIDTLRYWIERHAEETGSPRAGWILDKWHFMLPKFVKIFPHEYKRVLGVERKKQEVEKAAAHASSIATIAVNRQAIHG